jgi:chromate reductase, NAD(P)H dehydrogenase (quinone)
MITIIAGTNRKNSVSLQVAKAYSKILTTKKLSNQILDLHELPDDFAYSALYGKTNEKYNEIVQKYIYDASAFVMISPEYNGSYPGILKTFIDGWDRRALNNQKVALVGVASGRQGNSRGMDHLSAVLNYITLPIIPMLVPISSVDQLLNEKRELIHQETIDALLKQVAFFKN